MSEINLPFVSIITPAYNMAGFIEETIQSVLNQEYPNFEYVIIDDGSTDDTLEIIEKHKEKIQYISHQNIGETRTVNKAMKIAKGDILCVVSSDDPLLPGAIAAAIDVFLNNPEIVVAYPDWQMIDQKGDIIRYIRTPEYTYEYMLRSHECLPGPGTFFKKALAEKLEGRDEQFKFVADFDFWLRAGLWGPFKRISKILANHRIHPNSTTIAKKGEFMAEEHVRLIQKLYNGPVIPPNLMKLRREAFSSAYYFAGLVSNPHTFSRKKYFIRAFLSCPWKYFGEYKKRLAMIIAEIMSF